MWNIDVLVFMQFTVMLVQAMALLVSWRQDPSEKGLRDWGIAELMMALGSLLIVISILLAGGFNVVESETPLHFMLLLAFGIALADSGWIMIYVGTRRFFHRPTFGYPLVAVYLLLFFLALLPGLHSTEWRVGITSLSLMVIPLVIAMQIHSGSRYHSLASKLAILSLTGVCLIWFIRGLVIILWPGDELVRINVAALSFLGGIVLSVLYTLAGILMSNARINRKLEELAGQDALTGLANRRAFFRQASSLYATHERQGNKLALAIVDLDHFKQINDRFGHVTGDRVLKTFSETAKRFVRESDILARFGGEEFVFVFSGVNAEAANQALQRLQQEWKSVSSRIEGFGQQGTYSAGICDISGMKSVEEMLKRADEALYLAKNSGRDKLEMVDA